MRFGERLKEYMVDLGLTQESLEKATGITRSLISNFLLNKHTPSFDKLVALLYYFNCSADYLLGLTDIPTSETLCYVLPFNQRLRAILNDKNISQERLKRELNISGSVVYKWLSGKNSPSTDSLIKLAKFFDCSVDYLIGRLR